MTDHLTARVAALELLVEQLILERVQQSESPDTAVRTAMGMLTQMATDRPGVPLEAVGVIADILARVIDRLGEG